VRQKERSRERLSKKAKSPPEGKRIMAEMSGRPL
jgi:hypothetical protein